MSETPVAGRGQEPGMATYLRLILLAALIGIPAALVAAGFLALVHLRTRRRSPPPPAPDAEVPRA